MSTRMDKMMRSQNMVLAFGAAVCMGAAYVIMGNNGQGLFPAPDPTGDPTTWTRDELRRWLAARNLCPAESATQEELLERVQANMRITRQ
ncbi:hypothetical protein BHE90_005186 [Fusarium euwallaceae]|uniref:STE24 endopeptidase n=3 Tax=Fusarium solani species complex TaxID=232080 RepID=A0A428SSI6_9HYPO|nr:hypothetical protein CEP52_013641 [Fusarium oligoseptatum]RSL99054.1 hypothetical protein CDV31_012350 [Fusarium ambrosium]RTE80306.1 hypothetical protein BHE90_005186 [Fusarium euwallaceae]